MKNFRYLVFAALFAAVSCGQGLEIGDRVDETPYRKATQATLWLKDKATFASAATVEFYKGQTSAAIELTVGVTKAGAAMSGQVVVDSSYAGEGTLLPAANVTFTGADFSIAAGETSATVGVSFTLPGAGGDYVLALAIAGTDQRVVYTVKDMRGVGTADKGVLQKGMVMFDGGTNPLNTLCWELENGQLLFDMVVLFSSNINWDSNNDRPYLTHNQEIRWAFDNRETVLVPLQKRGVKIILSILGNHDKAGVAQLSALGAKEFAAEVARFVYENDLDGVFLDDEYSTATDLTSPYLDSRSYYNCARLYHELKKAMPDKLNLSYEYSMTHSTQMASAYAAVVPDVGQYVDIAVSDYPSAPAQAKGTLTLDECTRIAMDVASQRGSQLTAAIANDMVDRGYGWYMVFALSPENFARSYSWIQGGVEALYGSPLKYPTKQYAKMTFEPTDF